MRMKLFALAAAGILSTAAPAYAAINWDSPREAQRHFLRHYDQGAAMKSPHCRYVLRHQDRWGQNEIDYCRQLG